MSVAIASYLYPILHVWYSRDYAKSNLTTGTTGHIVVCVSPLTALMMDQRDKFQARGVAAFPFSFNFFLACAARDRSQEQRQQQLPFISTRRKSVFRPLVLEYLCSSIYGSDETVVCPYSRVICNEYHYHLGNCILISHPKRGDSIPKLVYTGNQTLSRR